MRPLGALAGGLLGLVAMAGSGVAQDRSFDFNKDRLFSVVPYGGEALGDRNDHAQAGAMVEFGPGRSDGGPGERAAARLKEMGVRDGAEFGDKGRWYAFV